MSELSTKAEQLLPVKSSIAYDAKIAAIDAEIAAMPDPSPDLWLKKSQAFVSQRLIREAIEALSRGISIDPFNGILYRWRAHRYLNVGEIAEACADFTVAQRLIPENWSVNYHLALTRLLLGEYDLAYFAYKRCWELPTTSARQVALSNWTWICCKLLGRDDEAEKAISYVDENTEAGGNIGYKHLCLMYKGKYTPEEILAMEKEPNNQEDAISAMTQGFGVTMYYKIMKDEANYQKTLDYVLDCGKEYGWTCFGYAGARAAKG